MKNLKAIFVLCVVMSLASVAGAQKVINFATWLAPTHPMNSIVLPQWAESVKKATNGRVVVKMENHVGHPKDIFDLVEDGVYNGGWSFHGYIPGRFKLTKMVELPGLTSNAEAASVAHWRVNERYLKKAGEHDGLTLIGLFTHGPGQIMMREPISGLADLKGKKIRVGGGVQGDIAKLMEITTVPAPGSKVYEILQTGVADGVFMPVGEQKTLNLSDVAKFIYRLPEGMYMGSFAIFLNNEFMDSLSKKDRDAIISLSGEELSALAGRVWNDNDGEGLKAAKSAGNKIVDASAAEVKKFQSLVKNMDQDWLKEVSDSKVDAKKALAEMRKIAKNYK